MKQDPKNKTKLWKREGFFIAIAATGLATLGFEMYKIGESVIVGPLQLSQEYTALRENLSQLEIDRQILDTELTAHYPIAINRDLSSYDIVRSNILKQNEISHQQTRQKISEFKTDIEVLNKYQENQNMFPNLPIALGLFAFGSFGYAISSNNYKNTKHNKNY